MSAPVGYRVYTPTPLKPAGILSKGGEVIKLRTKNHGTKLDRFLGSYKIAYNVLEVDFRVSSIIPLGNQRFYVKISNLLTPDILCEEREESKTR